MKSSDKRAAYKQLSEEEKKQHHIRSENKRREQIRSTFDSLVKVVPDLTESENRSEYAVLSKTSNYIRQLRGDNQRLLQIAKERGIEVPEDLKE
ncbi:hypothetical protein KL930_000096 [Ogataea haglerorum]|uniref:BHLH domain-containing protein n=1 Tax=Ogataea haglerorum TaxID=1937702 RepID=A0AAN6D573_9ASCO|nr:uncharacterized protein KL911_001037 [Ogataea haglerorum]KAG7697849.1 hypothetical protein KL951_002423 [Ogataea haglerorum]KAG7701450.1 hypothetical protein KL915_000481 [Ogataea haglerorum]KAG7706669.1 hypothetical protein KL950_003334 [Ogataea haglerorum]KAG7709409.1 hypothetical protein KL914_001799 [Ogataea haglerorum]KAG7717728.1 hypothetical protein KL913_002664 [Ogataea haglerorum]